MGEENDRELKMPSQIAAEDAITAQKTVETAEKATVQMAEQAGETPAKVRKLIKRDFLRYLKTKPLISMRYILITIIRVYISKEDASLTTIQCNVSRKCCKFK